MLAGEVNSSITSIACGFLKSNEDSCFKYIVV